MCIFVEGKTDIQSYYVMNKQTSTPSQIHRLQQTIYENLPVGMELYDGDGYLIEINSVGLKMMGVKDKQDMLGINIFENPNIPVEMKRRLRAGENIRFTVKYDFDLAKAHYPTVLSGISYLKLLYRSFWMKIRRLISFFS